MNSAIVQNNKGFSMVGVLAAGGMMGGLALFLAEMTKQQHVAQKVAETGVEITALHSRVISLLADGEACKKTLEGTPVSPAPTITGFKNRKGRDVLAVPSPPFNRLVKLRDAKLTNIQGTGTTREVEVELTFEKLSKAISGQKTVKRLIPLTLELDTANAISSCHSPQNYVMKEQLCKEMGGTWNGSNKKCSVPDCSTGQALTKTSTGFACVSAGSLPNCPNGKIIKRVGGTWKCEDPPSGGRGTSPLKDKKCGNDEILKGFDNGNPICVKGCLGNEVLKGFENDNNGNPVPICVSKNSSDPSPFEGWSISANDCVKGPTRPARYPNNKAVFLASWIVTNPRSSNQGNTFYGIMDQLVLPKRQTGRKIPMSYYEYRYLWGQYGNSSKADPEQEIDDVTCPSSRRVKRFSFALPIAGVNIATTIAHHSNLLLHLYCCQR